MMRQKDNPVSQILFTEEQISKKVSLLANQINRDYETLQPVLIGVLKGVFIFLADLMRKIEIGRASCRERV